VPSSPAAKAARPAEEAKLAMLDGIEPPNRKRLLATRALLKIGRSREAPPSALAWLSDAPDNPMAMYFSATVLWDNDESGKALDLLNRGVSAHPQAGG